MTAGIYLITFNDTDKVYVGQSSNIEDRWIRHLKDLQKGVHHSYKLQVHYNKNPNPQFDILEEVLNLDELTSIECVYIKEFNSYYEGFNCTTGQSVTGYGAEHPFSLYDKETYISIVRHLAYTDKPLKDIAKDLQVSLYVVNNISCLRKHHWIKDEMPIEYEFLLLKRDYISKPRGSNQDIEKAFLDMVKGIPIKELLLKYSLSERQLQHIKYKDCYKWLSQKYPKQYALLDNLKI